MVSAFWPDGVAGPAELDLDGSYSDGTDPVSVKGVVSPRRRYTHQVSDGTYRVDRFYFDVWRQGDGELGTERLRLVRALPAEAAVEEEIENYSVQHFTVILGNDGQHSVITEWFGPDTDDAALARAAHDLKQPVVITTDHFGELTLDRRSNRFEGTTTYIKHPVAVTLNGTDRGELTEQILNDASTAWLAMESISEQNTEQIILELLPLKNEDWLEEGEPLLTAADVRGKLQLERFTASHYQGVQRLDFMYNDGGLFSGHYITVTWTPTKGSSNVGLFG